MGLTDSRRAKHPDPLDRRTLIGRVGLDRVTMQIADVLEDPDFGRRDLQRVRGFRTTMGAPMLLDDIIVGTLNMWRNDVHALSTNGRWPSRRPSPPPPWRSTVADFVQELQERRAELAGRSRSWRLSARSVRRSAPVDIDRVLATIAMHGQVSPPIAARSWSTPTASTVSGCGASTEPISGWSTSCATCGSTSRRRSSDALPGNSRSPCQDLAAIGLDPHLQILYDDGWRFAWQSPR